MNLGLLFLNISKYSERVAFFKLNKITILSSFYILIKLYCFTDWAKSDRDRGDEVGFPGHLFRQKFCFRLGLFGKSSSCLKDTI